MGSTLDVFRVNGKFNKPLLLLFCIIAFLLLTNALLHDPTSGYDAHDHQNYIESLASHRRLPARSETGQYYSPPLPYILPAFLTALHTGIWKALKLAQLFNALLGVGLLFYLVKLADILSPQNARLKCLALGMLGLLPVFYRSFALIRGEPYLAFLAVFITYQSAVLFLRPDNSHRRLVSLGIALGLAILARQWGFFLLPPVFVFAVAVSLAHKEHLPRSLSSAAVALVIGLLVGGWFYILIARQYGTLTAFDRAPQPTSMAQVSTLLELDRSSLKLFSDPIRPSLGGRLFPVLYADTWGDYWGYFLVYDRNMTTGEYEDGIVFQSLISPAQVPPGFSTNRFTINTYLGALNILNVLASGLIVCGLLYGLLFMLRFFFGGAGDDYGRILALLAMVSGGSVAGYFWFILRYQSSLQGGDLIKATYLLQAFGPLALLASAFLDRFWHRFARLGTVIAALLGLTFLVELPAFITHYVHFSASPAVLGLLLSTLFFVVGLYVTYWIHTRHYLDIVVKPVAAPRHGPLISVCIPARNEASNIRPCLQAVLSQTYPNLQVVVLDDGSTDATPQILNEFSADPRLHVVGGKELPDGWAGKPHALAQAAAVARGDWLCFVDADTFLTPDALSSCISKAEATGADLFTIMTRQVMGTFWERVVLPLVMTALSVGFPPREVNDPHTRVAIANGQFIMIRRTAYDALGGHTQLKDKIVEDKALAELVKWNGYRLIVADGRLVARTRMYSSLPQMWEGWTKNIYLGLNEQPNLLVLGAFGAAVLVLAALFLPLWPLLGLYWYARGGGWIALIIILQALILWCAVLLARTRAAHGLNIPRWFALTTPLGAAIFASMMFVSTWKVLSGQGVTWRGRRYYPARD